MGWYYKQCDADGLPTHCIAHQCLVNITPAMDLGYHACSITHEALTDDLPGKDRDVLGICTMGQYNSLM